MVTLTLKLSLTSIQMLRLIVLFLRRKPNFLSSSLDIWMVMVKIWLRMVMRVIQKTSVMTMPMIISMKMTITMAMLIATIMMMTMLITVIMVMTMTR